MASEEGCYSLSFRVPDHDPSGQYSTSTLEEIGVPNNQDVTRHPVDQRPMPRAEQQLGVTDQMTASGTKPSLIIFQWKDEGSLCYQIEVNGIHVTRREDNNFINASKLMMVARVPRQERYRLLKSEQNLHFVKRGSMHLRGIW